MDRVARFIYVALVPPLLAVMASVIPVGGVLVTSTIATAVAVFGAARWQARMQQIPVAGRVLRGFARLGVFYDEHPPKPLVYYLAYPLLFPYWLANATARREFLLYRRISIVALVVTVTAGAIEYVRNWHPMLPFRLFAGEAIALFLFQLLTTFLLITPIVTTIVIFHQRHHTRSLIALLVVAGLTGAIGFAAVRAAQPLTASAAMRVHLRTQLAKPEAQAALSAGLDAAIAHPDDGDAVREALETFYRPDETRAFKVYRGDGVTLLYTKPTRRQPSIWVARDGAGHPVLALPPHARALVGT